jgi:hypothetical protein
MMMPRFLEMAIMEDDPLKRQKLKKAKEGFSRGRPQRRTPASRRRRRRRARANPFSRNVQQPTRSLPTPPRNAGPLDAPATRRIGDNMMAQDIGKREAQAEIAAGTKVTNRVTRSIRMAQVSESTRRSHQTQTETNEVETDTPTDTTPPSTDDNTSESENEQQSPIAPPARIRTQSAASRARRARTGQKTTNNDRVKDKRISQKIWLWNWNRERLFTYQPDITTPQGTRQTEGGGPGLPIGVVGDHYG